MKKWYLVFSIGLCVSLWEVPQAFGYGNAECKDPLSEVRLMNGTDRTIQGAVQRDAGALTGSESYYDIKPNEIRCWPRGDARLKIWIKDGSRTIEDLSGRGSTDTCSGSTPLTHGVAAPYSSTPPAFLRPEPCGGAGVNISISNSSGHVIALAVANSESVPSGPITLRLLPDGHTECCPLAVVEKPCIIIADTVGGQPASYRGQVGSSPARCGTSMGRAMARCGASTRQGSSTAGSPRPAASQARGST